MTSQDDETILNRVNEVYRLLVDETENPGTIHNERKNTLLNNLLEVFEYVINNVEENPLDWMFE